MTILDQIKKAINTQNKAKENFGGIKSKIAVGALAGATVLTMAACELTDIPDNSNPSNETEISFTESSTTDASNPHEYSDTNSEASDTISSDQSQEPSNEVSEEISEEVSEEISTEISTEVSKEVSTEVSKEVSAEVSAEVSTEISKDPDVSADTTEVSQEPAEDYSEEITKVLMDNFYDAESFFRASSLEYVKNWFKDYQFHWLEMDIDPTHLDPATGTTVIYGDKDGIRTKIYILSFRFTDPSGQRYSRPMAFWADSEALQNLINELGIPMSKLYTLKIEPNKNYSENTYKYLIDLLNDARSYFYMDEYIPEEPTK